ncbi:translation protein SH3-like domain-containing protein [Xylariaceae sp. FL0804]|nr:translation protein SH3-like domain-containing protein [Xylariaceae sp. FL0804]
MIAHPARPPLGGWRAVLRPASQQPGALLRLRHMATETTSTTTPADATPVPPAVPTEAAPTEAAPTGAAVERTAKQFAQLARLKPMYHSFVRTTVRRHPTAESVAATTGSSSSSSSSGSGRPPITTTTTRSGGKPTRLRSAFAVWPSPPSARNAHPSPLAEYHLQQQARLDRTGARRALVSREGGAGGVRAGDVVQVTTRRGEPFAGVCLAVRRAGVDTAVLLRNHLARVGVEMWFKIFSPSVVAVEIVRRRPKRARRARLYYMRRPKHDEASGVDALVTQWRRARSAFGSKRARGGGAGGPKSGGKNKR